MPQAVTEFQSLLTGLAQELETRIERLVATVRHLDQQDLLTFITTAAPELVTPFLDLVGTLTAVWYEEQDPESDFVAEPVDLLTADDLAAAARWAMLQIDPITAWAGDATKSLFDTSRETVATNAGREGVRWARHASEDACGFCRLLALKGFAYTSEKAALGTRNKGTAIEVAKSHDHCNCTAVPERGRRSDTNYPPSYLADWQQQYEAARRLVGSKAKRIANAMDYLPGGRRYKGDGKDPYVPREPVNLDQPNKPSQKPKSTTPAADLNPETDAQVGRRLLPGLKKSLADLRARGFAEDSPQIRYHLEQIARWERALQDA